MTKPSVMFPCSLPGCSISCWMMWCCSYWKTQECLCERTVVWLCVHCEAKWTSLFMCLHSDKLMSFFLTICVCFSSSLFGRCLHGFVSYYLFHIRMCISVDSVFSVCIWNYVSHQLQYLLRSVCVYPRLSAVVGSPDLERGTKTAQREEGVDWQQLSTPQFPGDSKHLSRWTICP